MQFFTPDSQLEEKLRKCSYITLSEEKRQRMKRQIMAALSSASAEEFSFAAIIEKIKLIALQILPQPYFRTLLKEKLITLAAFHSPRGLPAILRPGLRRRIFTLALTCVFLFTLVFHYTFKIERVEAAFLTTLEQTSGSVTVIRGNKSISGAPGFVLRKDDIVRTGNNSRTTIRFLDQSVSRLGENTEIKLSRLFINPSNKTETFVEIVLHRGRIWSRVINLISNFSSFQVKAANTVAVAKKKAAFDVSVSSSGKPKVSAVKNKVDFVVATDKKVMETTLVKGFEAEIKNGKPSVAQTAVSQNTSGEKDSWILDNLEEDKAYIETVKKENRAQIQNEAKVLPGNPLYSVKEFTEGTKIAFTLNDFERQKKILIAGSEKLAEAIPFLDKRETARAASLLQAFQTAVSEVLEWAKSFEATNPVEVLQLNTLAGELLAGYEKRLALLLPGDPLYPLKETISATKLLISESEFEKTEERLAQATNKLMEASDLAEQGDTAGAAEQVAAYQTAVSDFVTGVKQFSADEKEKAVTALIDNKVDNLKVLEAIASPAAPGTTSSLAAEQTAQEAKTDILAKLGEAVLDVQQDKPSIEVLQRLENIKDIDVNGKQLVNVNVSQNRVQIRTDTSVISVTGTSSSGVIGTTTFSPPKVNLGTPKLPQAQP